MTATVCLTYDFDAVSAWLWSYGSWEMPTRHSRGVFGAEVGAPRLLDLHDEYDIPATWFVPGHTIESFPEISGEIHDRGYDIQHHGWSHTGPASFESREAEMTDVERGIDAIVDVTGRKPDGYRSPAWDFSEHTLGILEELGFEWDSSKMASDFRLHYAHGGWRAPPDGPYDRGEPTDIVECPVSWQRDDWAPMVFTWDNPHRMGYASEDSVFQRWYDQFDWMVEHVPDGVFVLTMHPQVMGQGHRLSRLEDLVEHVLGTEGAEFRFLHDVAMEFKRG
ncbi:MAG: polysaccharide deacetylase [Haloferacaceae archaeon]